MNIYGGQKKKKKIKPKIQLIKKKIELMSCVFKALSEIKDLPRDQFDLMLSEKFTTQLSNGSEVELKPGGSDIPVTYELRVKKKKLINPSNLSCFVL